jgi:SAM-dependent methyltransferase
MAPKPAAGDNRAQSVNELLSRVLRCPDCGRAVSSQLICQGCGRSFAPDADGIISAMPSAMAHPAIDKDQLQGVIDAAGPGQHGETVVLYEQAFHDEQAPHYDGLFADPLPLRAYYQNLVQNQIYGYLKDVPFTVDLCCGTGKSSAPLADKGLVVIGIDVSREMLRVYRRKHPGANPILIHADASRPPLQRDSCRALSMIGGLHHIPDREGSLQSCCDALADGGVLILHEPLKSGQTSRLSKALENIYALADLPRVWGAIRRRLGLGARHTAAVKEEIPDFTPYERPFTSMGELTSAMPREMQPVTLRSQGALSFREFPRYLQTAIGRPIAWSIVRLDQWLVTPSSSAGDAVFAVFQKRQT